MKIVLSGICKYGNWGGMGMSNSKFLRFGILLCLVGGVLIHSNGGGKS